MVLRDARHPCLEVQDEMSFIPNDIEMIKSEHHLNRDHTPLTHVPSRRERVPDHQ